MAIVQVKFKRLKKNAGFTFTINGSDPGFLIKTTEKEYVQNFAGQQLKFEAEPNKLVWVDSYQVKRWYQW